MNLKNYKGIYYGQDSEKYSCPKTGAHFRFEKICWVLEIIRKERGDPDCLQLWKTSSINTKKNLTDVGSENFVEDYIDESVMPSEIKNSKGIVTKTLHELRRKLIND